VDKRDYVVSYEKINSLGFETEITVESGIDELLEVFPLIKIENKYQN
jgi:nucleoside-diphosphate-sugar epimerase